MDHPQPPAGDPRLATARAYRDCAGTAAGQLILADLAQKFGANPFRAGQPDATAFYCGCQAVLEEFGRQIDLANSQEPLPETSQT